MSAWPNCHVCDTRLRTVVSRWSGDLVCKHEEELRSEYVRSLSWKIADKAADKAGSDYLAAFTKALPDACIKAVAELREQISASCRS
jgi:hypothetical protein